MFRARGFEQKELDYCWNYCESMLVPPRFVLAILPQEGTGSFNTSVENRAADGGHGPNADWQKDVGLAVDLVRGKLMLFTQACSQGFLQAAYTATGERGNPYQYVNWLTCIVRGDGTVESGVYAQHASWYKGVRRFHEEFGGNVDELLRAANELDDLAPRVRMSFRTTFDDTALASNWNGTSPEPAAIVTAYEVVAPPAPASPPQDYPKIHLLIDGKEVEGNFWLQDNKVTGDLRPFLNALASHHWGWFFNFAKKTLSVASPAPKE